MWRCGQLSVAPASSQPAARGRMAPAAWGLRRGRAGQRRRRLRDRGGERQNRGGGGFWGTGGTGQDGDDGFHPSPTRRLRSLPLSLQHWRGARWRTVLIQGSARGSTGGDGGWLLHAASLDGGGATTAGPPQVLFWLPSTVFLLFVSLPFSLPSNPNKNPHKIRPNRRRWIPSRCPAAATWGGGRDRGSAVVRVGSPSDGRPVDVVLQPIREISGVVKLPRSKSLSTVSELLCMSSRGSKNYPKKKFGYSNQRTHGWTRKNDKLDANEWLLLLDVTDM